MLSRKLVLVLSTIGPGLFLIGYNIGTGSITTMAKTGAEHGMGLFWALVLSCLFTFILMVAYGQLTIVSGQTALQNIRRTIPGGRYLALYILVALVFGELLALVGIMGIVADLLREGSRLIWKGQGINTIWITAVLAAGLYSVLWQGRYMIFEKVLTVFVILMALCFAVVFVMVRPHINVILSGLVPRIPNVDGAFGLIAAMAGTTCSAPVFVMRSIVISEKRWTIENLAVEKRDALVSATMMLFLSGMVMAVAAGTLHVSGMKLHNTVEMISLFEPLGGKMAAFVLILGITGAGLSTVFPIVLIAPYLICDYTGKPRNLKSPLFRGLGLVGILFCFGMQFMEQRPPVLMVTSQAFLACILPAVAIPGMILINNKSLMGKHRASLVLNIGVIAVIIFSLVTTYLGVLEFWYGFKNL